MLVGRCFLAVAACIALWAATVPGKATTGWGCFQIINIGAGDDLNMRAQPSPGSAIVGRLKPQRHGIIAEAGACSPSGSPPSKQWCPIKHFDGDRTTQGWVRMIYLAPSHCP
jgi:hypothetical protein